jgi:hypothetical protein
MLEKKTIEHIHVSHSAYRRQKPSRLEKEAGNCPCKSDISSVLLEASSQVIFVVVVLFIDKSRYDKASWAPSYYIIVIMHARGSHMST